MFPNNTIIINIFWGLLAVAFLAFLLWPQKGILAYLEKVKMDKKRALLEDALKILFDCEYRKSTCTKQFLAENLSISSENLSILLERLKQMKLVVQHDNKLTLTEEGSSYALKVVRIHRIWEQYLAEETGIEQENWHEHADIQEHKLTSSEANLIASQIGNPIYDPHGDPIPTEKGELPSLSGQHLTELDKGTVGIITHIEDEPQPVYEQLLALGLHPGLPIYVLEKTDQKVSFSVDGEECVLTHRFAEGITVKVQTEEVASTEKKERLSSLKIGEAARVAGISPACKGQQRRRLLDLGIIKGTLIRAELQCVSGNPIGYLVMGTTLALRKDQADLIYIENKSE